MISIIVPIYNCEKYLKECIDSICNQTYTDLEIILVDDGSTDNSSMICDEYAKSDSRIIVIHKENGGATSARNAGLRIAKGEYIGFADSDDWAEPDMCKVLLENMTLHNSQISICTRYINNGNSEFKDDLCVPDGVYVKNDPEKTIIHNLFYKKDYKSRGITTSLWAKLFVRELILKHQFKIDERTKYAEDDVCVYSCLLDAERVSFVNEALYHYRMQDESITHSIDDTYFEKISIFYQQMKNVFMYHSDSDILMQKLKKYMLYHLLNGVNHNFGFSKHPLIPYHIPPYKILRENNISSIVLYGAGRVGQDYYQSIKNMYYIDIVGWVDKQYTKYVASGLPVESVEHIFNMQYDAILIAVENGELADKIKKELMGRGIDSDRIIWDSSQNFISNLEDFLN